MRYILSRKADDDLVQIFDYTVYHWSIRQAKIYTDKIIDAFEEICKKPEKGRNCSELRQGYWSWKTGSHIIFYTINYDEDLIEIMTILHQSMDFASRLYD